MWIIIKINKKKIFTLKKELFFKLGNGIKFYSPTIKLKKFIKNKILSTESPLLGDYLLCFNQNFKNESIINSIKYSRGLKYILSNFINSQKEIEDFVKKCKQNEDLNGYIKQSFFNFEQKENCKFISGPFTNFVFDILKENKKSLDIILGDYKVSVSKEQNLFRPV